jgi:GDSL-like Lipase/Acylhydrolase.
LTSTAPTIQGTGSAYSDIARPEGSQVTYVYISSKANENIRLCYRSEQTTTSTPVFPKVYTEATSEPGTAQIKDNLNEWITTQKESINFTQLEGKTLYALGDSYFAGNGLDPEYVWVSILAKKYNMAFTNYGINGSTVSNFITTKNPMCERYTNMASTAPDIVLVEGGRNDYNNSVPVGTVDSHDTKTFMGALNVTIEGLKTNTRKHVSSAQPSGSTMVRSTTTPTYRLHKPWNRLHSIRMCIALKPMTRQFLQSI